ncbi:MAG: YceI family protein, partial [Chloroflexi bacterium]|nr:YceI family protein [Chloroflexota bacterium]
AAPAAAGALAFTIQAGSKAVVRVNEQLADRTLPNDAVLTSEKVTGQFTLDPDGTFASSSKVAVDLTALSSDSAQRDRFIKDNTLQTRLFPEAVFVPVRATGLALPLAASGEVTFKLTGQMTIRGVTKELTFDVKAARSGADLTATATVAPAFQFSTFGMDQPRVLSVLSIKDEIRLEVQLTAKQ